MFSDEALMKDLPSNDMNWGETLGTVTLEFFSSVQRLALHPVLRPLLVLTW